MEDRKVLRWVVYIVFGVVAFLVSTVSTFPTTVAAQQLSQQMAKALPKNVGVEFGGVGLSFPIGVRATDVTLRVGRGAAAPTYEFDSVVIEPAIGALVRQEMGGHAAIELAGGTVEADFEQGDSGQVIFKAKADGVNLHSIPALASAARLPLMGSVGLEAEGEWKRDLSKSSFDATVQLGNFGVGAAKIMGFSLPTVSLGNVAMKLSSKQGKLNLQEFNQTGGNFSVEAAGGVTFKRSFFSSVLDLCFKLKGDDAFLKENPKLKTSLDLGTAVLHKDNQGFLHAPVKGAIRRIRTPSRSKPCKGM